jgi:hypothetical protein
MKLGEQRREERTMQTPEHNDDNCEKLADEIVQSWDLGSLIEFAMDTLKDRFAADPKEFDDAWQDFYPEEVYG